MKEHRLLFMTGGAPSPEQPNPEQIRAQLDQVHGELTRGVENVTVAPEVLTGLANARITQASETTDAARNRMKTATEQAAQAILRASPEASRANIVQLFGRIGTLTVAGNHPNETATIVLRTPDRDTNVIPDTVMTGLSAEQQTSIRNAVAAMPNASMRRVVTGTLERLQPNERQRMPDLLTRMTVGETALDNTAFSALMGLNMQQYIAANADARTALLTTAIPTAATRERVQNFLAATPDDQLPILRTFTEQGANAVRQENRRLPDVDRQGIERQGREILRGFNPTSGMTDKSFEQMKERVMGRLMMAGIDVSDENNILGIDATHPRGVANGNPNAQLRPVEDNMQRSMGKLMGMVRLFGSYFGEVRNATDTVRGRTNTNNTAPGADPIPENATPQERGRIEGINHMRPLPGAVVAGNNRVNFANIDIGGTNGPASNGRVTVVFEFNPTNGWQWGHEGGTMYALNAQTYSLTAAGLTPEQRATRERMNAIATALTPINARITQGVEAGTNETTARSEATNAIRTVDLAVDVYNRRLNTAPNSRPLGAVLVADINAKKTEINTILGTVTAAPTPAPTSGPNPAPTAPRRLTPEQLTRLQTLRTELAALTASVTTEYKNGMADLNTTARRTQGAEFMRPAARNETFGNDQLNEGNIVDNGGNEWTVDIDGWGNGGTMKVKWDAGEKSWRVAVVNGGQYTFFNVSDEAGNPAVWTEGQHGMNAAGRRQVNNCVTRFSNMQRPLPVDPARIEMPAS